MSDLKKNLLIWFNYLSELNHEWKNEWEYIENIHESEWHIKKIIITE